jgi:hypothetical protein
MGNKSRQRLCLIAQGYVSLLAMFSKATFLVSENWALDVGQQWILFIQLLQMSCPFVHSAMGGTMYSKQTGHFSTINRDSSKARGKSSTFRTKV